MSFTASDVMKLKEQTGCGMMDCKKALAATDGNFEKAIDFLREKGIATAQKKSSRIASMGVVDSYIHLGGKIGVLVEVNCETDFVAQNDTFKAFVHDVALQIAAANPKYVSQSEVPAEVLEKEKEILTVQARNEGKPENIIEKMVEGRIKKYYQDFCLLDQAFVKNPDLTINNYLVDTIAKIGEKITIRRFVRYEMGEGLEKKVDNFVDEVMSQANGNK